MLEDYSTFRIPYFPLVKPSKTISLAQTDLVSKPAVFPEFRKIQSIIKDLEDLRSQQLVSPIRSRQCLKFEDLINAEAKFGGELFGPIPAGHRRDFFYFKDQVWLWYESWSDLGQNQEFTVRYLVKPTGIYKQLAGHPNQLLSGRELTNFLQATENYLALVKARLY